MKKRILLDVIPLTCLLLAMFGAKLLPEYKTALIGAALVVCLVCTALSRKEA